LYETDFAPEIHVITTLHFQDVSRWEETLTSGIAQAVEIRTVSNLLLTPPRSVIAAEPKYDSRSAHVIVGSHVAVTATRAQESICRSGKGSHQRSQAIAQVPESPTRNNSTY
jgi:hypothetical protein